jgi:hypothetical protein
MSLKPDPQPPQQQRSAKEPAPTLPVNNAASLSKAPAAGVGKGKSNGNQQRSGRIEKPQHTGSLLGSLSRWIRNNGNSLDLLQHRGAEDEDLAEPIDGSVAAPIDREESPQ